MHLASSENIFSFGAICCLCIMYLHSTYLCSSSSTLTEMKMPLTRHSKWFIRKHKNKWMRGCETYYFEDGMNIELSWCCNPELNLRPPDSEMSMLTITLLRKVTIYTINSTLLTIHHKVYTINYKVHTKQGHTWYLSFYVHRQDFWIRKFTPKTRKLRQTDILWQHSVNCQTKNNSVKAILICVKNTHKL